MGKLAKDDFKFAEGLRSAVIDKNPKEAIKVAVAIQAFMSKPYSVGRKQIQAYRKAVQAFGVSTDFAQLTKDAFNVTIEEDNFDMGWQQAFRDVPLGPGQDSWEIYNVVNGITFRKVEEGGRIEMDKMSGSLVNAYVDYYGGALGFTDKMIRFRKVPAMIDKAMAFRNKFFADKANNHYMLLAAGAAGNITTYQGAAADGVTRRTILTINRAAFTLTNRCKDKGYGDMANAPLILYANPYDEERIEAAFKTVSADIVGARENGTAITARRIQRIYTYNSYISAGTPILVLPGQKLQKADAMEPTTYVAPVDPFTLNQAQAVWAIYGAIVADTDQCQTVTLG